MDIASKRERFRIWNQDNYVTTVPVFTAGFGESLLTLSPKAAFVALVTRFVSKNVAIEGDGAKKSSPRNVTDDIEQVSLLVYDDIEVIVRNYNRSVEISELSSSELFTLIEDAIKNDLKLDDFRNFTYQKG